MTNVRRQLVGSLLPLHFSSEQPAGSGDVMADKDHSKGRKAPEIMRGAGCIKAMGATPLGLLVCASGVHRTIIDNRAQAQFCTACLT